jgi:hypothetical protein
MVKKVNNINKIRAKKSAELVAKGEPALDPVMNLIIYYFVIKFVVRLITICK